MELEIVDMNHVEVINPLALKSFTNLSLYQHHRRIPWPTLARDEYDETVYKGQSLLHLMAASVEVADRMVGGSSQSPWIDHDEMGRHGWTVIDYRMMLDFDLSIDLLDVLPDLHLSTEPEAWHLLSIQHEKPYIQGGEYHPATNGDYTSLFNIQDPFHAGIIAWSMYSPRYRVQNMEDQRMPDLIRWSDLTFLEYYRLMMDIGGFSDDDSLIPAPKYIIIPQVTNTRTRTLMDSIIDRNDGSYQPWPGTSISTETDEGKAILGTTSASAVAWFLISHKSLFGNKKISEIVVWKSIKANILSRYLLFRIEDV